MLRHSLSLALLALAAAVPASAQLSTANLSAPRQNVAGVSVGHWVLFAGGRSGGMLSDVVDAYDTTTGTWSVGTLSAPRNNMAATVVGDLAFFAFGATTGHTSSNVIDVYDATVGPPSLAAAWSTVTRPASKFAVSATSVGTKALFAGGAFGGPLGPTGQTAAVDIYDASLGAPSSAAAWSTSVLSAGRANAAGVTAGGRAFFAGGIALPGAALDIVDIYDDATGTWAVAALSEARILGATGACAVGSRAYFAGGQTSASPTVMSDRVDIFDTATGAWSMDSLSLPRALVAANAVGSTALFAGGLTAASGPTDVIDVYQAGTNTWGTATLSSARLELGVAAIDGRAYFGGGGSTTGASTLVDIYDNRVGTSYCGPAVPNSSGAPGRLTVQGFPGSAAQGTLFLSADQLPQQAFGYFVCSETQGLALGVGGGPGTLCLDGAIGRYVGPGEIRNSGPSGRFESIVDLSSTPTPTGLVQVQAGQTWNFQGWFRDSVGGVATSNFTDAVSIVFL